MARLFEMAFDGGIRGVTVFHCIAEGKAREGGIVYCFDGYKPGERDSLGYRQMHGGIWQKHQH